MITKNYIKMAEQAEEIQKEWKPKDGDYFYGYEWSDMAWKERDIETKKISELATKEIHLLYFSGDDFNSCFPMGEEIGQEKNKPDLNKSFWLPTLEQLFEMVGETVEKYKIQMHFGINKSEDGFQLQVNPVNPNFNYEKEYFADSIKGCLLQYIYEEKYNKTWIGKKWVKANG